MSSAQFSLIPTELSAEQASRRSESFIYEESNQSMFSQEHENDNPFLISMDEGGLHAPPRLSKTTVAEEEYRLIAHIYAKLSNAPPEFQKWMRQSFGMKECVQMAKLTGVNAHSCLAAINYSRTGVLKLPNKGVGRGRKAQAKDKVLQGHITDIIRRTNLGGIPNTLGRVVNELRNEHGIRTSRSTVHRYLHASNFYWGKGVRRNFMHDAPHIVQYRLKYLTERFKNLVELDDGLIPMMPEVFLDESYCHLDHSSKNRWVERDGGIVCESSRQPLLVMFAAFVIYYDRDEQKVVGKFVENSVHIWAANSKASLQGNADHMQPNSQILANDHDYHGHFNHEVFEELFTTVCQSLVKMNLGPCKIHMDGARYHFHCPDRKPTAANKKSEIMEWLISHQFGIPPGSNGDRTPSKSELLAYIRTLDYQPRYTVWDIALENGGHWIIRTPPYHCELQPIELIWGVIKNSVAYMISGSMAADQLIQMLKELFRNVQVKTFVSAWKKTLSFAYRYMQEIRGQTFETAEVQEELEQIFHSIDFSEATFNRLFGIGAARGRYNVLIEPMEDGDIGDEVDEVEEDVDLIPTSRSLAPDELEEDDNSMPASPSARFYRH